MPYTLGIDFGTESGRVLLLNLSNGQEMGVSVVPYPCGVISGFLPSTGAKLPPDWALQDPRDYLHVLEEGIPEVLRQTGISAEYVIGLGVDFTSCTVLPVTENGTPLSILPEWADRPHAWTKLWKHHSAQNYADRLTELARSRGEEFLARYGGRVSSEWYFPKLLEIFVQDRSVYEAAFAFVEATDWIIWQLTGELMRNSCTAGYKALWLQREGLPATEYFCAVNAEFSLPQEKLGTKFYPLGTRAGFLKPEMAKILGLSKKTAVAVGNVDAHVSVPGVGVTGPGPLVMVIGTSICHLTMTAEEVLLPGITGVVKDGILPDFYGYEAGQAAVGDMFAWYIKQALPRDLATRAAGVDLSVHEYLESLARDLRPGQSGLMALDWWNGNRSILGDAGLSGVLVGLSLSTKPEEIYRALLESVAFGTRRIIENFRENRINITEIVACGGIAVKSPLLMQLYADINGLPVTVRQSSEIPARGAALFGAVAAGVEAGGFCSIQEAAAALESPVSRNYQPDKTQRKAYDRLYVLYRELYEYFGQNRVGLLHELKAMRLQTLMGKKD